MISKLRLFPAWQNRSMINTTLSNSENLCLFHPRRSVGIAARDDHARSGLKYHRGVRSPHMFRRASVSLASDGLIMAGLMPMEVWQEISVFTTAMWTNWIKMCHILNRSRVKGGGRRSERKDESGFRSEAKRGNVWKMSSSSLGDAL